MSNKNKRKLTEQEIDAYVEKMRQGITSHLDGIRALLPPGYVVTFIARQPGSDDAHMVLSTDPDLEAVADVILQNKKADVDERKD